MSLKVHFSSKSKVWETPKSLFDTISNDYGPFNLDVCASPQNAKCEKFFTEEDDGLSQKWYGKCWMNPPYGRRIKDWMKKAYESSLEGATVVCLVPSRTDTKWWHDYAMKGEVSFIKGRVKFVGAEHVAPFPSAIVVFYSEK